MSTAALITVEEYLRRTEKPNAEYIDGVVRPKPMPTKFHALLEFFLVQMLRRRGLEAASELTVRLSPTRYLVPDVVAAPHLQSPYPTDPVLLCAEILSPDDRVGATLAKCEEYHAWGVPFCWVLDPVKRIAWDYPKGGEPSRIEATGKLEAGDIVISLEELYGQLTD